MDRRNGLVKATARLCLVTVGLHLGGAEALAQSAGGSASAALDIRHDPLKCVTTAVPSEVEAAVAPGPDLGKGYVYFRAASTQDYYYVPMSGDPAKLAGLLPRPMPETKGIDYYLQARDKKDRLKSTPAYAAPVTKETVCERKDTASVISERSEALADKVKRSGDAQGAAALQHLSRDLRTGSLEEARQLLASNEALRNLERGGSAGRSESFAREVIETIRLARTLVQEWAGLTIGLTYDKQNPVPAGFNAKDIANVILATGQVVSLAEAMKLAGTTASGAAAAGTTAAAGGKGAGGTILAVLGGLAAAGGGVALAAAAKESDEVPRPDVLAEVMAQIGYLSNSTLSNGALRPETRHSCNACDVWLGKTSAPAGTYVLTTSVSACPGSPQPSTIPIRFALKLVDPKTNTPLSGGCDIQERWVPLNQTVELCRISLN